MSNRNSTGCPVEIFIAFLNEISNSKTFEANLQNSSGRPVESSGRPLDQMIWAITYLRAVHHCKEIIKLFHFDLH